MWGVGGDLSNVEGGLSDVERGALSDLKRRGTSLTWRGRGPQ